MARGFHEMEAGFREMEPGLSGAARAMHGNLLTLRGVLALLQGKVRGLRGKVARRWGKAERSRGKTRTNAMRRSSSKQPSLGRYPQLVLNLLHKRHDFARGEVGVIHQAQLTPEINEPTFFSVER